MSCIGADVRKRARILPTSRFGSNRLGGLFGPLMLLYLLTIGASGIYNVTKYPGCFAGFNPYYAFWGIGHTWWVSPSQRHVSSSCI